MSCNGCRVLRKGCSDTCTLRSCLQWIESPEAQGHATVFVAKFFGRAGMISFISAVPESQRPALFQSLLYEACGRTVNPVFGAVGLLWSGNWGLCQAAVETVLKGGSLKPAACLSAVSTKPIQPLANISKVPFTHPSPTLANNPSLKRPHSMIESTISAEIKRPRSSDQHQEIPDLRSEAANLLQGQINDVICRQVCAVVSKPAELSAKSEIMMQEERPTPSGQLIAPVARRLRPQMGYGSAALVVREQACEEQERLIEESYGTVELDLTLNSHANLANMSGRMMGSPGVVRVSSPSSFSVNSEGSVTSSDTAGFSVSCVRTLSQRHEERQLLHLL